MNEQSECAPAVASMVARMNLGHWGRDHDVPWWLALGVRPQAQLAASLVSAVHLMAQAKGVHDRPQQEAMGRLMTEVIDDLCGAASARRFPPRQWGQILDQLGVLADGYAPGSLLREATLELCQRVVVRMRQAGAQAGGSAGGQPSSQQ